VVKLLDFGFQPPCNGFLKVPNDPEYTHPLVLNLCEICGLIQINDPVPINEIQPRYEWIAYNEPEGHLDQVAERITHLEAISRRDLILGISYKDDSILRRLKERGFQNVRRLDPLEDLKISQHLAGTETIQDRLTPEIADDISRKYGLAELVVARHILEHAYDTRKFIKALTRLLKPNGYIVIEAPDCTQSLEHLDYTMPWEEHILYLTAGAFRSLFVFNGLSLVDYHCFPYLHENSLVGMAQVKNGSHVSLPTQSETSGEKNRAYNYAQQFSGQRKRYKEFFAEQKRRRKVALLGAGHLACVFINLLELKDYIEFIVDDNPNKKGLFMPGSHLAICGSTALMEKDIKLCLLSVSPESERTVIQRNKMFIDNAGTFGSMFPVSENAIAV
jgi:hypothetical protein